MNLYRLDYEFEDGSTRAVKALIGGDFLTRYASAARERAKRVARDSLTPVAITRISGGGAMKRTAIAQPDGTFKRPVVA